MRARAAWRAANSFMRGASRAVLALLAVFLPLAVVYAQAAAPAGVPDVRLVDITKSTGIHFDHLSSPAKKYIVESMSGGVAIIDYNRDGLPDIYFTNAPDVSMQLKGEKARGALYRNNGDGTFTDVTQQAGVGTPCWAMGVAVGDYNNDGWPDLLVTCLDGVVLYRNNGDGTFTDVTKQSGLGKDHGWATGASFADYDGDGYDDLFVPHYVAFSLKNLPEIGSARTCMYHNIAVQCGPRGMKGSPDNLYHNNRNGTFTDVTAQAGVGDRQGLFGLTSLWHDFNGDGHLDLFVANDSGSNYLYINNGHNHFTDEAEVAGVAYNADGFEQANMGVALGDYLHTGRFSIAITHSSEEYTALYRNDGHLDFNDVSFKSGIARPTSEMVGWGDAFVDLDNSGWLDFFQVNGHVYPQVDSQPIGTHFLEPKQLFWNNHDGTFRDVSNLVGPAIQIPQVSRGLAVADLFNDGHEDLVVENLQGQPMILRPEFTNHNHWVEFELEGVKSNRLALNAVLTATAGTLVQKQEILSGGSYISQDSLRVHFGLGMHDHLDKLQIHWPAGDTETLTKIPADHIYAIKEGAGIVPFREIRPAAPVKH
ncbi:MULTISPECIES: CRTAC1 family protein [Acidobacterium]|nr:MULTISPECIES: CRTAC1 family protein [Acidobacterium]